ncbi:MAG: hypothetical protein WBA57_00685 [Elainellaceae cyanobacterium]
MGGHMREAIALLMVELRVEQIFPVSVPISVDMKLQRERIILRPHL